MKKTFLLSGLFGLTITIAIIGFCIDKTSAGSWDGDDPLWMEMGNNTGQARSEQVRCTRTTTTNETHTFIWNDTPEHIHYNPPSKEEVWFGTAIFCDCAGVMLTSCNPFNPCY